MQMQVGAYIMETCFAILFSITASASSQASTQVSISGQVRAFQVASTILTPSVKHSVIRFDRSPFPLTLGTPKRCDLSVYHPKEQP